jgi:hypothetical protein
MFNAGSFFDMDTSTKGALSAYTADNYHTFLTISGGAHALTTSNNMLSQAQFDGLHRNHWQGHLAISYSSFHQFYADRYCDPTTHMGPSFDKGGSPLACNPIPSDVTALVYDDEEGNSPSAEQRDPRDYAADFVYNAKQMGKIAILAPGCDLLWLLDPKWNRDQYKCADELQIPLASVAPTVGGPDIIVLQEQKLEAIPYGPALSQSYNAVVHYAVQAIHKANPNVDVVAEVSMGAIQDYGATPDDLQHDAYTVGNDSPKADGLWILSPSNANIANLNAKGDTADAKWATAELAAAATLTPKLLQWQNPSQ